MSFTAKTQEYKTQLLILQIQEAAKADDSPYWPRAQLIEVLEQLIATYERLDNLRQ